MESCYLYYNSIRLQIQDKQRKNALSYIGFLLAKDLDNSNGKIPDNIIL